jgi:hypothetical protein
MIRVFFIANVHPAAENKETNNKMNPLTTLDQADMNPTDRLLRYSNPSKIIKSSAILFEW